MLRGVGEPLRLYRVRQAALQPDPVCGREVHPPPAARLAHAEAELWFCSKGCLREFLATEAAA